jgi:cytochrome c5
MSKHDTHFVNIFSLVIGLLVLIAICIFAFARFVGGHTQGKQVLQETHYHNKVAARLQPPSQVAVAGQDNSALAIKSAGAAAAALASSTGGPKNGSEVYQQVCSACHTAGIAGAPKAGDQAAWGPRIAQGKPTLYEHALKGYQGKSGMMPAKGGRVDLSDELIEQSVDYMVQMEQ